VSISASRLWTRWGVNPLFLGDAGDDQPADLGAVVAHAQQRAATAQCLVIRMRGNYQHTLGHSSIPTNRLSMRRPAIIIIDNSLSNGEDPVGA
jgi:hypothetical protein